MAECFDRCWDKLCGFRNREQSLKNYPLYRGSKSNFADEECYIISAHSKIKKTFFHKEIRQPNGAGNFLRLVHVKCHVPNRSENQWSLNQFGGNLFSSLCGILDVKSISVRRPIRRADLF